VKVAVDIGIGCYRPRVPAPRTVFASAVVLTAAAFVVALAVPARSTPAGDGWPPELRDHVVGVGADGLDVTAVRTDLRDGEDGLAVAICEHVRRQAGGRTVHVVGGGGLVLAASRNGVCVQAG